MTSALLLAVLGCAPRGLPEDADAPVVVRSWLEAPPTEAGGTLVVQTEYDPAGTVDLPDVVADGLVVEPLGPPVVERIGDHDVVTQRYGFHGPKGAYELGAPVATWRGPDGEVQGTGAAVFVDLGVAPPREQDPQDIVEPDHVRTVPWGLVGSALGGLGVLGAGLYVAFGWTRRRDLPEAPPEPPDVVAIRAWEAIRSDPTLDEHGKALALSRIFREYAEAVLSFPASAWTTTEILDHLKRLARMPEGNVPRARRLLRATDLVKFADHEPGHDFFDDLDADLRAFVGSTRPTRWEAP